MNYTICLIQLSRDSLRHIILHNAPLPVFVNYNRHISRLQLALFATNYGVNNILTKKILIV